MAISTILSHHGMLWSVGKNEEETGKKKKKRGGGGGCSEYQKVDLIVLIALNSSNKNAISGPLLDKNQLNYADPKIIDW